MQVDLFRRVIAGLFVLLMGLVAALPFHRTPPPPLETLPSTIDNFQADSDTHAPVAQLQSGSLPTAPSTQESAANREAPLATSGSTQKASFPPAEIAGDSVRPNPTMADSAHAPLGQQNVGSQTAASTIPTVPTLGRDWQAMAAAGRTHSAPLGLHRQAPTLRRAMAVAGSQSQTQATPSPHGLNAVARSPQVVDAAVAPARRLHGAGPSAAGAPPFPTQRIPIHLARRNNFHRPLAPRPRK